MGWFDKKKKPSGGGRQPEPPRTPGRSSSHSHNYSILLNRVITFEKGKGSKRTTDYLACTCGMQTTRTY